MGRILATSIELGVGEVKNEHIDQVTRIDSSKIKHMHHAGTNFALVIGGIPTTREYIIYVASQAGVIRGVHGLFNECGSAMGITYDLKKNGVSVLSAPISFTHADPDKTPKDGSVVDVNYAENDVFSIAMTVTTSTGAQGPYAWVEFEEIAPHA